MNIINLSNDFDADFVHRVEEESGQKVSLCYQCGNCTAGCPYTFAYDIPVSQIMRNKKKKRQPSLPLTGARRPSTTSAIIVRWERLATRPTRVPPPGPNKLRLLRVGHGPLPDRVAGRP